MLKPHSEQGTAGHGSVCLLVRESQLSQNRLYVPVALLNSNRAMGRVTPRALLTLAILHLSAARTSPPHIVFILADDLVSYRTSVYVQV